METTVKLWARYTGRIKCYGLFHLLFWSGSTRPPLQRVGIPKVIQGKRPPKTTVKNMSAIQRSDQKLSPFSAFIPVWRDMTSSSTSRDSIGTTRKTASGTYCKTLSAIQRSDQKLWPFSAFIPVSRDNTTSSTSRHFIGNTRTMASGTYCKTLSAIQRSDQKLWPFSAFILVCCNKTTSSTSRDSISNTRKTASGN
jgi:hypothetical protein